MILLVVALGDRTADDQRSTRIVDQYAVHLIHHRIMVLALYHLIRRMHHIVTQIIETEFIIGTIGNVCTISLPARLAVRLVFVDTIHRKTQPLEDRTVPFGVTTGQIVIHRHDMNPFTSECVEIGGKRGHKRLTFTRGHFRDLSLMQYRPTDKLNVIMHHVPGDRTASSHPGIIIYGLLSIDPDMFFLYAQIPVQLGSSSDHLGVFL